MRPLKVCSNITAVLCTQNPDNQNHLEIYTLIIKIIWKFQSWFENVMKALLQTCLHYWPWLLSSILVPVLTVYESVKKAQIGNNYLHDFCSNTVTAIAVLHVVRTHQTVLPPTLDFAALPASCPAIWKREPMMNCRDVCVWFFSGRLWCFEKMALTWCIPVIEATGIIFIAIGVLVSV